MTQGIQELNMGCLLNKELFNASPMGGGYDIKKCHNCEKKASVHT